MILISALVEFLGCTLIVFFGTFARYYLKDDNSSISLVYFLLYSTLISVFSPISGAIFNPILTLMLFLFQQLSTKKGIVMIVSQLIGSLAGASLALSVLSSTLTIEVVHIPLPEMENQKFYLASVLEAIVLLLITIVFGCLMINVRNPKFIVGFAVGFFYYVGKLVFGKISGGAFNLVESFGPSLLNGKFESMIFYTVSHAIGCLIGIVLYIMLIKDHVKHLMDDDDTTNQDLLEPEDNEKSIKKE